MIFDANNLPSSATLQADLCIIGSGAGGSMVAKVAAEAGMKVMVLEAGALITPDMMTQREEEMFPKLFWESGGRANKDNNIHIYQGKGIGGSTLHNLNLIRRIPTPILEDWIKRRGLKNLSLDEWDKLYTEVEEMLGVTPITDIMMNRHNKLLQEGCNKLGWRGGLMKHNRTGCVGSGFCEVGCAFDAKNNACKILVPKAVEAGAEFITHCQASRIVHRNNHVTGVEAYVMQAERQMPLSKIEIKAERICLSASATGTAEIILRSQLPHPDGTVGETLHIHPAVMVAGEFAEPVRAWQGVPQTYECTEFLDFEESVKDENNTEYIAGKKANRLWIINAFAHPMGTSTLLPGHGKVHSELMSRYENMGVFTAMLHDQTAGTVKPKKKLGLEIDYKLNKKDSDELREGLKACAQLILATGAERAIIPTNPLTVIKDEKDLSKIDAITINKETLDLAAVHPMGTVPMGDDRKTAAVDSSGKYLHTEGLWIADGSLFPTSIGVAPQLSIYSMGLHVGRKIVQQG